MTDPDFVEPMLATLVEETPEGREWVFERKLDGIRLVVVRDGDEVRLMTRNSLDRVHTYPELAEALAAQPCDRFVADGEVVAFDGQVTSFGRLQQRSGLEDPTEARRSGITVVLYLFDLMHRGDDDITGWPLRRRKSELLEVIDFDDPVRFCAHRNAPIGNYLDEACSKGWEGLIAKRADRPYHSGRSRDWLKLKCVARQELVIGGYTEPKGSRTGFGALLVGYYDDTRLIYAGRVGTGFDRAALEELHDMLSERTRRSSPFADAPGGQQVHWVDRSWCARWASPSGPAPVASATPGSWECAATRPLATWCSRPPKRRR